MTENASMITYKKRLQMLWHEYERQIGRPARLRDAIQWGLQNGKLVEPQLDPIAKLVSDLKDAVRSETNTDDQGREYRVNASVTFASEDGIQDSLWGNVDSPATPHDFVVAHFGQRRKGILDDCAKLKASVDHYMDAHPDRPRYQLVLDFTDDVAEREAMRDAEMGKAAE
jgi:hypothetical protein